LWAGSDDVGSVKDPQIVAADGGCLLLESFSEVETQLFG
jgi:hypothetical protein